MASRDFTRTCHLCDSKHLDWGAALTGLLRCDDCTPAWRVRSFEPLTPKAKKRRKAADLADAAALPRPQARA